MIIIWVGCDLCFYDVMSYLDVLSLNELTDIN